MRSATKAISETDEAKRNRETVESIAKNIASLARSVQALINGPLKRQTLVILLANSTGLSQGAVSRVLECLVDFEKDWLNK